MRNTDATPEEQELLAVLHARMVLKGSLQKREKIVR
jgi:hypothetical protein